MKLEVLLVALQRGALQAGIGGGREPELAGLRDRDAAARSGVRSGPHVDPGRVVVGVGILLAGEGLDVAVAVLIAVVNDPRLLRLSGWTDPAPSSHRHR